MDCRNPLWKFIRKRIGFNGWYLEHRLRERKAIEGVVEDDGCWQWCAVGCLSFTSIVIFRSIRFSICCFVSIPTSVDVFYFLIFRCVQFLRVGFHVPVPVLSMSITLFLCLPSFFSTRLAVWNYSMLLQAWFVQYFLFLMVCACLPSLFLSFFLSLPLFVPFFFSSNPPSLCFFIFFHCHLDF